jgi:hypothetical protein
MLDNATPHYVRLKPATIYTPTYWFRGQALSKYCTLHREYNYRGRILHLCGMDKPARTPRERICTCKVGSPEDEKLGKTYAQQRVLERVNDSIAVGTENGNRSKHPEQVAVHQPLF